MSKRVGVSLQEAFEAYTEMLLRVGALTPEQRMELYSVMDSAADSFVELSEVRYREREERREERRRLVPWYRRWLA